MAPGFDQLSEQDLDEYGEVDFSDLEEKYRDIREDQGFDNFVVVDGLPVVTEDQRPKLVKFLMRSLNKVGSVKDGEESVFMPIAESGKSEGFAFVEYASAEQAMAATKQLHGVALDKKHTLSVNKLTDVDRYGREGRVDDEYQAPYIEPFADKEHLRSWLGDPNARDQFAMFRGDNVGVFWNNKKEDPEPVVDRKHWTQLFVTWSPLGTYLASIHQQGVQLWGGPQFTKQRQLPHPFVSLVQFSPQENYVVTWSNQPISVDPDGKGPLTIDEDGKHIVIWDCTTGKPMRSFAAYDLTPPPGIDGAVPPKAKVQWPAFKWSADERFVARMKPNESLSIYELPSMSIIRDANKERKSIKIEGIMDFEWAPATPEREGIKQDKRPEQLLAYWTPEMGSKPASVALMSVPSREIVRTRNLFNVTDAKLHWQSEAKFMCVKVDRHSKSKKSMATNLEIFRVREKGVPVEVVDSLKDTVINFAWEPKGDRFVIITAGETVAGSNVLPKTGVSFFGPEKAKTAGVTGPFKHVKSFDKKNSNGIYWSPKGRFVLVGTISVQQHCDLDFYDMDYEGDKTVDDDKVSANLMLMNTEEHYGVTDVEWDPTGRFVITSASMWTHQMENGYKLWSFSGQILKEDPVEKFKQLHWRPRPPTLLSKEEQKGVRRNLREYAKEFEELDKEMEEGANAAVVDARRRLYSEWYAWLNAEVEDVKYEREDLGIPDPEEELALQKTKSSAQGEETVEEVVEEVVDETEEFV